MWPKKNSRGYPCNPRRHRVQDLILDERELGPAEGGQDMGWWTFDSAARTRSRRLSCEMWILPATGQAPATIYSDRPRWERPTLRDLELAGRRLDG